MEFKHYSVMLNECIEMLNIRKDGIYVDGTMGGAGHSFEIAKKLEILIKNKKTREEMGKNNRKLAEEKFDRKQTYKEIIKLMF